MVKGPGRIFLVVGPSGAGKNTLINAALGSLDYLQFVPSVTTRAMRSGEQDGRSYFFTTDEDFGRMLAAGDLLEYQMVHGKLYGTSKKHLFAPLATGMSAITDIDILGAFKLKALHPDLVTVVFILVPSLDHLERRIRARSALSAEEISLRMARVVMEMSLSYACDAFVVNEDVATATDSLRRIIAAESDDADRTPTKVLKVRIPQLDKQFHVALAPGEREPMALERGLRAAWWEDHPGAFWFDLPAFETVPQADGSWQVLLRGAKTW